MPASAVRLASAEVRSSWGQVRYSIEHQALPAIPHLCSWSAAERLRGSVISACIAANLVTGVCRLVGQPRQ